MYSNAFTLGGAYKKGNTLKRWYKTQTVYTRCKQRLRFKEKYSGEKETKRFFHNATTTNKRYI